MKISKLYSIMINDILESRVQPQRITGFEEISEKELGDVVQQFGTDGLVTALMGASPETKLRMLPELNFERIKKQCRQGSNRNC